MTLSITAIIPTLNEELNLEECLRSIQWCEKILVVDSGSTDGTRRIAEKHGASIVEHPFENHTAQWSWALASLPITTEWVLGLDADQRVSDALIGSIRNAFRQGDPACDGFYLCRRQIFRGQWIRHGGYYPKYLLKLFRRSRVILDPEDIAEHHFHVRGSSRKLAGDLIEDNRNEMDLSAWCEKHVQYAKRVALEETRRRAGKRQWAIRANPWGSPDQRSVGAKQLWDHLPLYTRCYLYFLYRYFLQLGFLDGPEGRRFHLLQGFWYRLLIDAYIDAGWKNGERPG